MLIAIKTQQKYRITYSVIEYFIFLTLDALYGTNAKEIPSYKTNITESDVLFVTMLRVKEVW